MQSRSDVALNIVAASTSISGVTQTSGVAQGLTDGVTLAEVTRIPDSSPTWLSRDVGTFASLAVVADDDEEDDPDLAEAIRLSQLDTMNIEDERRREKEELEEV